MQKIIAAMLLLLSYSATAQLSNTNTMSLGIYQTAGVAQKLNLGITNNYRLASSECWASWASFDFIIGGVVCLGGSGYALLTNQWHQNQQEILTGFAVGAGLFGAGCLLAKIGERYDRNHPFQPEHHWHNQYHYHPHYGHHC